MVHVADWLDARRGRRLNAMTAPPMPASRRRRASTWRATASAHAAERDAGQDRADRRRATPTRRSPRRSAGPSRSSTLRVRRVARRPARRRARARRPSVIAAPQQQRLRASVLRRDLGRASCRSRLAAADRRRSRFLLADSEPPRSRRRTARMQLAGRKAARFSTRRRSTRIKAAPPARRLCRHRRRGAGLS